MSPINEFMTKNILDIRSKEEIKLIYDFTLRNHLFFYMKGLECNKLLNNTFLTHRVVEIVRNKTKIKLGLFDGLLGQLLFLINHKSNFKEIVENSLNYILDISKENSGFLKINEYALSPYLSDGTAGLIYVLAKFKKRYKDDSYDVILKKLANNILFRIPKVSGIANGAAGFCLVLFEMYEIFEEDIYLKNAIDLMKFIESDVLFYENREIQFNKKYKSDFLHGLTGILYTYNKIKEVL